MIRAIVVSLLGWKHETALVCELADPSTILSFLVEAYCDDYSIAVFSENELFIFVMIPSDDVESIPPELVRAIVETVFLQANSETPPPIKKDDNSDFSAN